MLKFITRIFRPKPSVDRILRRMTSVIGQLEAHSEASAGRRLKELSRCEKIRKKMQYKLTDSLAKAGHHDDESARAAKVAGNFRKLLAAD